MSDAFDAIGVQLRAAGFREVEPSCFTSAASARVVGLAVCPADPEIWRRETEHLLNKETIRRALSWARYVIIIVDSPKTRPLAWSAAAFAQNVSKCRRIVLFYDRTTDALPSVPFVGLQPLSYGVDAPARDVEAVVRRTLPPVLADAFLTEDLATARLQVLAEESDS